MTLRIPAKVLIHVWSYDFYYMTLSTGKQRRHMINIYKIYQNVSTENFRFISVCCMGFRNEYGSKYSFKK